MGFHDSSVGKESACYAGDPGSIPRSEKIPWRRSRLPTPVFWPGEFHGLYSQTRLSAFHFHFSFSEDSDKNLRTTHVDACQRGWRSENITLPEMILPRLSLLGLQENTRKNFLAVTLFLKVHRVYTLSIHNLPSLVTSPGLLLPGMTSLSAEQQELGLPAEWESEGRGEGEGKSLSRVRLFATPWTAAYQAPPSMEFSRQEYWRIRTMSLIRSVSGTPGLGVAFRKEGQNWLLTSQLT